MKNSVKQNNGRCGKWLLIVALAFGVAAPAGAAVLSHGNSTINIDENSQAGVNQWLVDGTQTLNQQWLWYRIGSSSPEQSINTIGAPTVTVISPYSTRLVYTSPGLFDIQVTYTLQGGQLGSGTADLSEQIRINNLSANPLDFHLFLYSDFNLGNLPGGQNLSMSQNLLGKFNRATQAPGPALLQQTIISPGASHGEAGVAGFTLGRLNDAVATTLNDNANAVGDVTWAFQWDSQIAAGGSFLVGADNRVVVPEPASIALAGLGLALLLGVARRRRLG
ncbi:MAG TPA: PEP-CTERM sorting domain-containing protein [Verrucomicrobiae bacterium]|nr:PEP-CTERM sorting domain-containing protein [Verrucomicrobiae bacterium]